MTWHEMMEKAQLLVKKAGEILSGAGDDGLTEEQKTEVDRLLTEAEGLYADADKLRGDDDREERFKRLQDKLESKAARARAGGDGLPSAGMDSRNGRNQFKGWTDFLVAVRGGRDRRLQPVDEVLDREEKALAEGAGESGGYLVPTQQMTEMMEIAAESAIVRPRAFPFPMGSRSVTYPMLDQTTAPTAGETAFFGGVVMSWFEENTDLAEADVDFKQGELVAHGLGGWIPVPNNLIANSAVSLGSMIPRLFGGAAAWAEDWACLRGDGVKKPLGVMHSPATIFVNRDGANDFKFVDAVTMLSNLLAASWGRAVWVMQQTVLPKLYQMQDAASQYIWLPNASEKGPGTLLGLPIEFTEKLPALGTKGDVLLCDFGYYLLGDRQRAAVASSIHERFRKNQTTFRLTQWLDGQPWLDNEITLADASTTVSPFVGLDVP